MLASPRDARVAACAVLVLAGAVVANVAFMQGKPRERRAGQIPVGLATPLPEAQRASEARRTGGPVTLSLASLIEAATPVAAPQSHSTAPTSVAPAQAVAASPPAPEGRMPGIARSIDRLVTAPPAASQVAAPTRQQELVRQVQGELAARGYAPGPVDGDAGLLTRAAILAFEHDQGLPATAEATDAILAALRAPARRSLSGANWRSPSQTAIALVKTAQQQLIAAGHLTGAPTGQLDARTIAAIRSFEMASDMMATGRISAQLMARLQRTGTARARVASER